MSTSSSIYSGGICSQEELAEKYQKLLPEYYRTKAQHSVLKKAVLTEKANNAKLLEQLKAKEQELRKLEQELDVLNFHNNSLAKKVELLQETKTKSTVKGWVSNTTKKQLEELSVKLEAAVLDLQTKIFENETLHRDLDDSKSSNLSIQEELKSNNLDLEARLTQLTTEHQEFKETQAHDLASLTKQKEEMQLEIQRIMDSMTRLNPEQPDETTSVATSPKPGHQFVELQLLALYSYLLSNSEITAPTWALEFPPVFFRELIKKTSRDIEVSFVQLFSGTRSVFEAAEKRLLYLSDELSSSDLSRIAAKFRESHRRLDRTLGKLKTLFSTLVKEDYSDCLTMGSKTIQATKSFQDLRSTCEDLFNLLAEISSMAVSCLTIEKSIKLASHDSCSQLETNLSELISCSKKLAASSKVTATPTTSSQEFLESIQHLWGHLVATFKAACDKLTSEGKTATEHGLLKVLNAQVIVDIISTELVLKNVFDCIERWLIVFTCVDFSIYSQLTNSDASASHAMDSRSLSESLVRVFRKEFSSLVPYEESFRVLTVALSNQEEREDIKLKLKQELEKSQSLETILQTLQSQVHQSETDLITMQSKQRDLNERLGVALNDSETKDQLIKELEKKIKQVDDSIIRLLEEEDAIDLKRSQRPSVNGHLTNGASVPPSKEKSHPIKPTKPSTERKPTKLNGVHHPINTSSTNTQLPSNGPQGTPHKIQFAASLPVNQLDHIKREQDRYHAELKSLTERIEVADSQALRFHDAWLAASDRAEKSQIANDDLRRQVALLTEQLTKSKDEFESVESNYKRHIEDMTEQFAQLVQGKNQSLI